MARAQLGIDENFENFISFFVLLRMNPPGQSADSQLICRLIERRKRTAQESQQQ